jgi:hypothetical protein
MTHPRHVLAASALALCLLSIGPDAAAQATAPVRGKVAFEGKPVAAGRIVFYIDDDEFLGAKIKNGAFRLKHVPAGTWHVAIESDDVPAKYRGEETSGLRVEVKGRVANQFDFELAE